MTKLISEHCHVISFIPPPLHPHVAELCVELNKNMTTSSYISPYLESLDAKCKEKGLIFLNECGLDPGIDIMTTMKVVDHAR
jgi:saccharopine dehydrogenase (NADP+, L-glutamate forming)